jgi:hypothetical protein
MHSREVAEHETASQNVRFTPKSGHLPVLCSRSLGSVSLRVCSLLEASNSE